MIGSSYVFFKKIVIAFLIVLSCVSLFSQNGKIVLIGGGMERSQINGWNYQLFSWIVNNAQNKRIAVIGTSTGDGWLEQNFVNTWGATYSKEFVITSSNANQQILYDSLVTYNAVYFRGGDQYYYYNWYRNTKTQQAIAYIFQSGGVIAGTSAGLHILTGVIFTDDTGNGLISTEAIENPTHSNITLHNDFFQFLPDIYGDSHFSERGRFGRLIGIMANRWFQSGENIMGIGVDDLTAITIDDNNIATVYGTGCANIFIAPDSAFSRHPASNGKLLANGVRVIQLLKGTSFDLNTHAIINNMTIPSNISIPEEKGDYTLFLSGGNTLSQNDDMLLDFLNTLQSLQDTIIVLTGSTISTAEQFKNQLMNFGASNVIVRSAISSEGTNAQFAVEVQRAKAFLFVNNTYSALNSFLSTPNGFLLKTTIINPEKVIGFVGDNSRFAGAVVVENYMTQYASYDALLQFLPGLSLLSTTVIMPNTFASANMYENSVTAVPFAMTNHGLSYGVWLYSKNYLKYFIENNASWFTSYGSGPAMILKNTSSFWGNSQQTSTGSGTPRQITGFDNMELFLIDQSIKFQTGDSVFTTISDYSHGQNSEYQLFPNPASDYITLMGNGTFSYEIFNIHGQCVQTKSEIHNVTVVNTDFLQSGVYFLRLFQDVSQRTIIKKLIIQK